MSRKVSDAKSAQKKPIENYFIRTGGASRPETRKLREAPSLESAESTPPEGHGSVDNRSSQADKPTRPDSRVAAGGTVVREEETASALPVSHSPQESQIDDLNSTEFITVPASVPASVTVSAEEEYETSNEADSSSSPDMKKPAKKRSRKAIQRYVKDWEKKILWITDSHKGAAYAYCVVCEQDIKCTGGFLDLQRHGRTAKHLSNEKKDEVISNKNIMTSFLSKRDGLIDAELRLCAWGAQNNIPITTIESFSKIAKEIFHDSRTAQTMQLGRTKITAIQTNVFGKCQNQELVQLMKSNKWSLLCDESTDLTGRKSLAMVVRLHTWDENSLIIRDCFYKIITVTDTSASALYEVMISQFQADGVPYKDNMVGLGTDGANVMMGQNHSVAALFRKDCPGIFLMKCICHSFALCSSYACKYIPSEVEQLCRDVYNFLKYGGQRVARFENLQSLLELQPLKMLHPSATRWLSLEAVVSRMLERYEVLLMYFNFLDEKADKSTKEKQAAIRTELQKPLTKTYLLFLHYILPVINKLNRLFQAEKPELCRLHNEVSNLLRSILDNFLSNKHMMSCKDLSKVSLEQSNYKPLESMYIGAAAKAHLEQLKTSNKIQQKDTTQFLTNVMNFYISLVNQIQMRIKLEDPVLVHMVIIDPKNVIKRTHESIVPLVTVFAHIVADNSVQDLDTEFREVRNIDFSDFTDEQRGSTVSFWSRVLSAQQCDEQFKYPELRKFIPQLLILPHSSASVERLFSHYNLNKTKMRNRLSTETMQGLLATKDYVKSHTKNGKLQLTAALKHNFNSAMYKEK